MKRSLGLITAGLAVIAAIFWITWANTSSPLELGGFTLNHIPAATSKARFVSLDDAFALVSDYLSEIAGSEFRIAELMEFDNHFYAAIQEVNSDRFAFELLVDPLTGQVVPEPGPNMMWNTKYGHMRGHHMAPFSGQDSEGQQGRFDEIGVREIAQEFLDSTMPGTTIDSHPRLFHGYYTMHIDQAEEPIGMLSVNAINGRVWMHSWHGTLLRILAIEEQF